MTLSPPEHRPGPTTARLATPLQHNLARNILDMLRERGAQPGDPVSRLALAKALGVSRTPVVAATRLLETLGAVETRGRSVRVRSLAPRPELQNDAPEENVPARLLVAIARGRAGGSIPDEVSERQLALTLGAGRSAVAQALAQFAEAGIATRNRGNGWRFTAGFASPRERSASYRFRLLVEPAALLEPDFTLTSGFAERTRREHIRFLERGWSDELAVAFFRTNAEFHLGLAEASGNRFMAAAVAQQNRVRMLTNYVWHLGPDRVRVSVKEHLEILDALGAGDRERASLLMRLHLTQAMALRHYEGERSD